MNSYGSLDLTLLGRIVKQQPNLVREVTLKNGETHKFIGISHDEHQPDTYGNVGSLKVACKKEERVQGINYFVANLKPSKQNSPAAQPAQPTNNGNNDDELPF